jgi:MFS transporter, putative metabolite:H+ symporter
MPDRAELLTRFENLPFTRWHTRARIVVGSATFFDGFDSLSLAFVLPVLIRLWNITPAESGLLISSSYVGQIFGALTFSWLAEKYGRIRSITAAVVLMSIMSVGCALSTNFAMLFAFRFVQGIGLGGEMPVAAAYISEVSKARGRGRFFILYEMIFPIGLMAAGQIGALVVPALGWQIMLLSGGIPGLIIAFLLTRLPESPRWLISKGRVAEAERIVKEVEASAGTVAVSVFPSTTGTAPVERSRWIELFAGSYASRTFVVWTLWFVAYFITNSLNNWMPSLYNTVYGLGLRESLRAASMTNVAQVLVLLLCAFFIDRVGRRNWTVACFVVGGVLLAILGLAGSRSVTSVMILATVSYGIVGSVNAVLYLYTPEIYPTRMRAIGTGLATSWLRLGSAIGPTVVGLMVASIGTGSVFLMFAAAAVVGAVVGFYMIETRARRLEEIAS